ncbi:tRNA-splicing endonuclease subunit sen54 [Coemansia javaensis]|uniref:tRNA-splicing endonuclease subunit sen54 n=1 Tax=Coemansia javaensis TaxID=2761396 RepID=A0A9W8HIP3_9FUNG|nr:tRNA-splicing endonuclease subunit sen54 [Coemansia javaensis]
MAGPASDAAAEDAPAGLALFAGDGGVPRRLQAPSAAAGERARIGGLLDAYRRLLSVAPRRARKSCVGAWRPGEAHVTVARPVDTIARTAGATRGGATRLQPEEWLLFVERGSLVVSAPGGELSCAGAWAAALGAAGLDLAAYRGYACLRRLGYVVVCGDGAEPDASAHHHHHHHSPRPRGPPGPAFSHGDVFRGLLRAAPRPLALAGERWPADPCTQRTGRAYQVYSPSRPYKKRSPGPPQYRMVVADAHAPFPGLRELCGLARPGSAVPAILGASEPGGVLLLRVQAFETPPAPAP